MHLGSLQGVSPQRGASPRRTTRLSRGYTGRSLCPPRGAPLWAWLLLGTLALPGAWSFLSEEQEEMLVELHNHYRGQVTPSASAMMPLKWDPNLKVIAENYAAKCIWNHNAELEDTGENLFAGTGALDLREALEKWFLEYMNYDYQNNSCDEDKMCGHYTQMVWADTHRVGCAFHLCNNMENLEWERVSFLVCNYYPAGNYEDQRPYVEGDWCSSCPENLQKCENNLCVPEMDDEDDLEDGDDEEDWTTEPPPVTSDPFPEATTEQEQTEKATPPPDTTDSYVTSATSTAAAGDTEDTEDTVDTVVPEDRPPSAIPDPDSMLPDKPSTAPETEERVERKREEETKKTEDEERKEKRDQIKEKVEREEREKIYQNKAINAGSVSSSSLLFACLIAILTMRL